MRRAVFAGSFDPCTLGHVDLIRRGAELFDELVVAVGENPRKQGWLPLDERLDALRSVTDDLPTVSVDSFRGLMVDYAERVQAGYLLRGVRTTSDFEFELQMGLTNRMLDPTLEVVLLLPAREYATLSSTLVREIAVNGGDVRRFVPEPVAAAIRRRTSDD